MNTLSRDVANVTLISIFYKEYSSTTYHRNAMQALISIYG